jgi:hypothetical protein
MLVWNIYPIPFLAIAVANFMGSWLYYSPAMPWFIRWSEATGMDSDMDKSAMTGLMAGAALSSLLFSYVLQVVVHSIEATDFATGALVGLLLWAGFALTHSLNTRFEGRKTVVLVINNGLYLLSYVAFGGIAAIWW